MYYVTMKDNFMSGWGQAEGKTNIYMVCCDTAYQAEQIEHAAKARDEMSNIRVSESEPYYNPNKYLVSEKNYSELGAIWKPEV